MSKPKPKSKNKQFLDEDCVKYVQIDDVDSVDKYITRAKDLEVFLSQRTEDTGQTLLLIAAEEASVECADRLIECGAETNEIGQRGFTPLHWCAYIGYPNHITVAKRLMEENETDVRIVSDEFETPMFLAIKLERFELADLILDRKRGADINHQARNGNTNLIAAAFANKMNIIEHCISRGCDVNVKNMNGETAFMVACKMNNMDVAGALLHNGAEVNTRDRVGRTVLMASIMAMQTGVAEALMSLGYEEDEGQEDGDGGKDKGGGEEKGEGEDVDKAAAKTKKKEAEEEEVVRLEKVELDAQDDWGYSALMYSVKNKNMNSISQTLIEKGADVLVQDRHGNTAIILAASKKNLEMVQKLILAGADVKHKNDEDQNVLTIVGEDIAWELERYIVKQKPRAAKPRRKDYKWRVKVKDIDREDEVLAFRRKPDRGGHDDLSVLQSEEGSVRESMSVASAKYDAPGVRLEDTAAKQEAGE